MATASSSGSKEKNDQQERWVSKKPRLKKKKYISQLRRWKMKNHMLLRSVGLVKSFFTWWQVQKAKVYTSSRALGTIPYDSISCLLDKYQEKVGIDDLVGLSSMKLQKFHIGFYQSELALQAVVWKHN